MRKPDEKTAAICGLFCGNCPCYPQDCHGCLSDKLTASCTFCPAGFRACAAEKGCVRCSDCAQFPCERLRDFSTQHWENGICHHAQVMDNLLHIRQWGAVDFVAEMTRRCTCTVCGRLVPWYQAQCMHGAGEERDAHA